MLLAAGAKEAPKEWDGLERVPSKKLRLAYVRPGASLTGYKHVRLDPVQVAFDKNRDPNSSQRDPSRRLSRDDLEAITADLATEFRKVFGETLGKSGYPLVEEEEDDDPSRNGDHHGFVHHCAGHDVRRSLPYLCSGYRPHDAGD